VIGVKRERANNDVRELIKNAGLWHWMVFQEMGISEPTWSRLMRFPLDPEVREKIISIVDKLSNQTAQ
jgi:hypothetical protein